MTAIADGGREALPGPGVGSTTPAAQLEQAVSAIVRWTTRHDVQAETMRRARCTLPTAGVWLLTRISACGPTHPSDLAHFLGVDNSTISPRLQRLEREGLVSRSCDPLDRRAALVKISPAGSRMVKRLHEARRQMYEELLQDWSPEQQVEVASSAAFLAARLEGSWTR